MFRSKVVVAIAGVIIIGSVSALGALLFSGIGAPSIPPATAQHVADSQSTATISSTSSPTRFAAPSPTAAPARATSTPRPPRPTPTLPPIGQALDLHGRITGVNATTQTFTFRENVGVTWTIQVNASTTYQGAATSFGALNTNLSAEVAGVTTDTRTLLATTVNSSVLPPDN